MSIWDNFTFFRTGFYSTAVKYMENKKYNNKTNLNKKY